jgi:hypothetical protein
MRKSESRSGIRPVRAGIAVAATAVAVIAGTTVPAFAATPGTIDVTTGQLGGGDTTALTATGAFEDMTVASARVTTAASCPTTFGSTSGTNPAATVSLDDDDTATVTVPAHGTPGTYRVCVYALASGTILGTTPLTANSTNTIVLGGAYTLPTLSASAGPVAGGNQITATLAGPWLSSASTPAVVFRATACNATYSTTTATTATVTKNTAHTIATVTVPSTLTAGTPYNICFYAGTGGTAALLGKATYTPLPAATLSPAAGNSGGTNTITLTTATAAIATTTPYTLFTPTASCPTDFDSIGDDDVSAGASKKISNSKVAITVPAGVLHDPAEPTTPYRVCLYVDGTTGALIAAPPTYSVAPILDLDPTTILPAGGPAQGGTSVTVTVGGGIPTAEDAILSASLGGSPLENIDVTSATEFTATTTSHAAGAVTLSVTTAAGTQISPSAAFTYSYGITISPTTDQPYATSATSPTLDIMGAGFNNLVFGDPADGSTAIDVTASASAHVLLVSNAWFTTADGGGNGKNTSVVGQCIDVTVISDNELICTLDLNTTLDTTTWMTVAGDVPAGTYSVVVVNELSDTTLSATQYSRVSSGSTFTVADY